jgi:hypothetical protein
MIGFQSARFVQTRPLPINVTMPRTPHRAMSRSKWPPLKSIAILCLSKLVPITIQKAPAR